MFPLLCVKVIENTNHFLSMDNSGAVKIWDFRKFNCIQSFTVETDDEKHKFHLQAMTYIPKPLKLVFVGRNINCWEYDKNYNPTSVDDSVVVAVAYRPQNNTIITPAGNKIKVWNALNGEVKRIFSDITQAEITAFTLDYYKKRCLIGFSDGEAAVFNVLNGAKIKTLTKHNHEINFILEARNLEQIITASNHDGIIMFHVDTDINESEHIRSIVINDASLSALVYKPEQKMLITGTQVGIIAFWEGETGKFLGQCTPFPNEEITNICPHSDLEYIIVATSLGKIAILAIPPLPYRYSKVFQFNNLDVETGVPNYINYLIWSNKKRLLFVADEKSYVKVYDLNKTIEEIYADKKAKMIKDDSGSYSKFRLNPPELSKEDPPLLWATKAHLEPIRAIEYVESEDLVFTSGLDKRVKIWSASTGKYIDSLQQKYDKFEPIPIAFKKPGQDGIYAPNLHDRIDKEYLFKKKMEDLEEAERAAENPFTKLLAMSNQANNEVQSPAAKSRQSGGSPSSPMLSRKGTSQNLLQNNKTLKSMKTRMAHEILFMKQEQDKEKIATEQKNVLVNQILETLPWNAISNDPDKLLQEAEKEEFDPYYNWTLMETKELQNLKSTPWKLHINFDNSKREFENYVKEVLPLFYHLTL